jgi:hypothetical protein
VDTLLAARVEKRREEARLRKGLAARESSASAGLIRENHVLLYFVHRF